MADMDQTVEYTGPYRRLAMDFIDDTQTPQPLPPGRDPLRGHR